MQSKSSSLSGFPSKRSSVSEESLFSCSLSCVLLQNLSEDSWLGLHPRENGTQNNLSGHLIDDNLRADKMNFLQVCSSLKQI